MNYFDPLDPERLSAASSWRIRVVAETESTNADLLAAAAAAAGEPAGAVLAAEFQRAGRGRLDRSWTSPAGAGLTVSMLLRPEVPSTGWGWLPLLAGVSLADTVGPSAALKWPNDLLLSPAWQKAGGILVQAAGTAVVIGIGLNVHTAAEDLPAGATSLQQAGNPELNRTSLLLDLLQRFQHRYQAWQDENGDAEASGLAADYRLCSATIGQRVRAELAGSPVLGRASGIDSAGRLIISAERAGDQDAVIAAGDVIHVRAEPDGDAIRVPD